MTSAILGVITGLGASIATGVIDIIKSDKEAAAKAEEMKAQAAIISATSQARIAEMRVASELKINETSQQADIDEGKNLLEHDSSLVGTGFIDGLRKSVRPVITYEFVLLFTVFKTIMLIYAIKSGYSLKDIAEIIFDDLTQTLFGSALSFWFGSRTIDKFRKR